jgi:hypothetical protein
MSTIPLHHDDVQNRWWALVDLPPEERESQILAWLKDLLSMSAEAREEAVAEIARVEADFDDVAWFDVAGARLRALTRLDPEDARAMMQVFETVETKQQTLGGLRRRLVPAGACQELTLDELGRARHFLPAAPQLAGLPVRARAWQR